MPGIRKKRKEVSVIEDEQERRILLCPHCIEYGFKKPLRHKILMKGEKPATDYENWCQCLACGKVFARHEVKVEGILTDTIELVNNPHDIGPSITGLGNKLKRNSRERERQKLLDRIEEENDPEIKAALRKGNTVQIIE